MEGPSLRKVTHPGGLDLGLAGAGRRASGSKQQLLCGGVSVKALIIYNCTSELWSHESFGEAVIGCLWWFFTW